MISVENFLVEVASRVTQISSMISDMKQYTLSFEVDFHGLQELALTLEAMNDKIIARKIRSGKSEKFEASPAKDDKKIKEKEDKKANRVSRGVDRAKQMMKTNEKKV